MRNKTDEVSHTMTQTQVITAENDTELLVEQHFAEDTVEVTIHLQTDRNCLLHWGLRRHPQGPWQLPPRSGWPQGSQSFDHSALQTPFAAGNGSRHITLKVQHPEQSPLLDFVLYYPQDAHWDNNNGRNYRIELATGRIPAATPEQFLGRLLESDSIVYQHVYHLAGNRQLAVAASRLEESYQIDLLADLSAPLLLHWGLSRRSRYEWLPPPTSLQPQDTTLFQDKAAQTPFADYEGMQRLSLSIPLQDAPAGIPFVLHQPGTGRWIKDGGNNFFVPLTPPGAGTASLHDSLLQELADEIIAKEMSRNSWTLMHRFNLCCDLLDRVHDNIPGQGLLFVWLRFSALRQLDWQRNYNTKPRELGHALDRLTEKLADRYSRQPEQREMIRLMFGTLGRGNDAQRVRDEVLHIMHRHHIKEVSGHFMEEWHQKLHNNTTPDDIVICEAYLEFLRSNGDLNRFYERLAEQGVSKERLENYERPITSHPDFVPDLKDVLIQDFEHFLGILKDVHQSTDLGVAINAARHLFDAEMHRLMDTIWHHHADPDMPVPELARELTRARQRLAEQIEQPGQTVRDLLFLDIALEQFLRLAVESGSHVDADTQTLMPLLESLLENICLSRSDPNLSAALGRWRRVQALPRSDPQRPLQIKAVLDQLERSMGTFIEQTQQLLQPPAEFLGEAFQADSWTIELFSEEVIRGRLEFALALLLRHFDARLRKSAQLGDWQVISPGSAAGTVATAAAMKAVQGKPFPQPTVLVVEKIVGDEEIPQGVTAVITPDTTDIVSHVAIRARNARVLFATCYDPATLERLRSFAGHWLQLKTDATGAVTFTEGTEPASIPARRARVKRPSAAPLPSFSGYAIAAEAFDTRKVGGKSNNLQKLRGKLQDWVRLPAAVALPFGVFAKVLSESPNREVAKNYRALTEGIDRLEAAPLRQRLAQLRETVLELEAPAKLQATLQQVMKAAGLPDPGDWAEAWLCVKRVWASKWNERACLSRKAMGIPHSRLLMAVLVQEIVAADYSYVVHTVNPLTGNRNEIYAEVVLGLGETLVGNYPGRALSFTCTKDNGEPHILSFPSKDAALYGSGLIFRSDSNGEDLTDYAGAGLYDSFMLPAPRRTALNYSREPLLWDEDFRRLLLDGIARIGSMIESVLSSPQDIEGAYADGHFYVVQTRPQVGIDEA